MDCHKRLQIEYNNRPIKDANSNSGVILFVGAASVWLPCSEKKKK
jgi:hypothetical protein